jgi:DMSO/TMAO reductase YedYZ molybdopterin-dependent catalytic subunit
MWGMNSHPSSLPTRAAGAVAGVLAAFAGLAAGELVAATGATWSSPVVAIGDVLVDAVPRPLKDLAIQLFGTGDKIALIVGILVVLAIAAAGIGVVARSRRLLSLVLTGGFGVIGVLATVLAPENGFAQAVPSLMAGAAAVGLLAFLTRPAVEAVDAPEAEANARRRFLRDSAGATLGVAVIGGSGRGLSNLRSASIEADRAGLGLPAPTELASVPANVQLDVPGITPFETSNTDFYRIDTQLTVPRLSRDGWTVEVKGMVDNPMILTVEQLERDFEVIERVVTMTCVSLEIGGDLMGTARWRGVRLSDVLEAAGVQAGADQLVGRAFDDWTSGFPVEAVYDRDAMIVFGMNGEPLPAEHGFPLRLIVEGLYGYVSATKWLTEIELTTFDAFDNYWVQRDWAPAGPIKTQSRIDTPRGLQTVGRGTIPIAGVAWAQRRGIEQVEVQVDGGAWEVAELAPALNDVTWRQWVYRWDTTGLTAGRHDLSVRATDATGETQTEDRQLPFPDGATGWQTVACIVGDDPA